MPLSDGHGSGPAIAAHGDSFHLSQSSIATDPLGLYPVQNPPPLPVDESTFQQNPPIPGYYSDQLREHEPRYAHQPQFMLGPPTSSDQSLVPYGPNLLDMSNSPPVPSQEIVSPDGLCQYSMVADPGLVETVSPEGCDAPLYEQHSNYDILLPNQRGGKRGPFKDPSLREQTAMTRKTGSCIRCRMQRIRVSVVPRSR